MTATTGGTTPAGSPVKWLKEKRNNHKSNSHDSTTFFASDQEDAQSDSQSVPDARSSLELEIDTARVALGSLGALAQELACIPLSRELAAGICNVPFSATTQRECGGKETAILVVSIGEDSSEAARVIQSLTVGNSVPVIAVVIAAPSGTWAQSTAAAGQDPDLALQFAKSLSSCRSALFRSGADDVVSLMPGEALQPHRVIDGIERSKHFSAQVAEIVSVEVRAATESAARKANQDQNRLLKELLSVSEASLLEEWIGENGELTGVSDFNFQVELGKGAFGQVFKATHPRLGVTAVKVVTKASIKNATRVADLDRELTIMRYVAPHPNLVSAQQVLHAKRNIFIVMDYAGEMHLHAFTKAHLKQQGGETLPVEVIERFGKQEVTAMAHLHSHLICHRDIKPSNWIVSDDGLRLRLADFGFAQKLVSEQHHLTSCCGSLPFCAPEVFRLKQRKRNGGVELTCNSLAADVWSLGVNFVELLRGPFGVEELLGWYPRHPKELDVILKGLEGLSSIWQALSASALAVPSMHALVCGMLTLDPATRSSMPQVVATDFDVLADLSMSASGSASLSASSPHATSSTSTTSTTASSQPRSKPSKASRLQSPAATPKIGIRGRSEKFQANVDFQRCQTADAMTRVKSLGDQGGRSDVGPDSWRQGWAMEASPSMTSRMSAASPHRIDGSPWGGSRAVPTLAAKPFLPGVDKSRPTSKLDS
mmetsp:Transcript_2639/g.5821  ORF Transcript_2639/g.5821 Transcript_2639/m.5821 type:complete len:712 (-) Transcript_2639:174-2309(-)